jgi:hypothetical protein
MMALMASSRSPVASEGVVRSYDLLEYAAEVLRVCSRAGAAAHHYEDLARLSDAELAARGLKRADLPKAALDKLDKEC